jgi:phage/plasmid-associated DNA primase
MGLDSLPEVLRNLKRFCVRIGKVPYISDGGDGFSPKWTQSGNWMSYDQAVQAVKCGAHYPKGGKEVTFDGIGYLNARSDPQIVGGDLDCCRNPATGVLSQWATTFLNEIKPFYAEVSPSKCGVRFFVQAEFIKDADIILGNGPQDDLTIETITRIRAAKPGIEKKIAKGEPCYNGLEMYAAGRHLSITGDKLDAYCNELEDRTEAFKVLIAPFVEPPQKLVSFQPSKSVSSGLPELNILDLIDTTGFEESGGQLLGPHPTEGSTTGHNLVINPSKNVYAYMHNGLNVGGGPWQWLACECGVARWEDDSTGSLSTPAAMVAVKEYAIKRGLFTAEQLNYAPLPEQREMPVIKIKQLNKEMFGEDIFKDDEIAGFKYIPEMAVDTILSYFDVRATPDRKIWVYKDGYYRANGQSIIDSTILEIVGNEYNARAGMETTRMILIRAMTEYEEMDTDINLVCCKNRVLNIATGEDFPHDPKYNMTRCINANFVRGADCPRIRQFYQEISDKQIDRDMLIDWVALHAFRKAFPYVMFLLGQGRNGKGVYEDLLMKFYGEQFFSNMDLEQTRKNDFAKGELRGKFGLIVSEATEEDFKGKKVIKTNFLKKCCGSGFIDSGVKGVQERQRFRPTFKATLDCNDMPRVDDESKAWIERFCKADLPFTFLDEPEPDKLGITQFKKDPDLILKLTTEKEMSGYLNWILERTKVIAKEGKIRKRSGKEMTDEYRLQSHSIDAFLEEFCDYEESGKMADDVPTEAVYKAYEVYCELMNAALSNMNSFGFRLKKMCDNNKSEQIRDPKDWTRRIRVYRGLKFDAMRFNMFVGEKQKTLKSIHIDYGNEISTGNVPKTMGISTGNMHKDYGNGNEEKLIDSGGNVMSMIKPSQDVLETSTRDVNSLNSESLSSNIVHSKEYDITSRVSRVCDNITLTRTKEGTPILPMSEISEKYSRDVLQDVMAIDSDSKNAILNESIAVLRIDNSGQTHDVNTPFPPGKNSEENGEIQNKTEEPEKKAIISGKFVGDQEYALSKAVNHLGEFGFPVNVSSVKTYLKANNSEMADHVIDRYLKIHEKVN